MTDTIILPERKVKRAFPAEHVINWYLGNYIESPNNGIREDKNWRSVWFDDIEKLRKELKGSQITHSDFIRLVRERGIHGKYYRYKGYENHCEACRALGINA